MRWLKLAIMLFLILFAVSCQTTKEKEVPVYKEKKIPYKTTEKKTVTKEVPTKKTLIELREPYFPKKDEDLKISVINFTSSAAKKGSAEEIQNELELRLQQRVQLYSRGKEKELKREFNKWYNKSEYYYPDGFDTLYKKWKKANEVQRYKIVNREQIEMIMQERSLKDKMKAANILGVDIFISGHVKSIKSSDTSFIIKTINPSTAEVYMTKRFSSSYNKALSDAVDAFFFNIIEKKVVEVPVKKEVTEEREVTKYKEEKKKVGTKTKEYKETSFVGTFLLIGLVALLAL